MADDLVYDRVPSMREETVQDTDVLNCPSLKQERLNMCVRGFSYYKGRRSFCTTHVKTGDRTTIEFVGRSFFLWCPNLCNYLAGEEVSIRVPAV